MKTNITLINGEIKRGFIPPLKAYGGTSQVQI